MTKVAESPVFTGPRSVLLEVTLLLECLVSRGVGLPLRAPYGHVGVGQFRAQRAEQQPVAGQRGERLHVRQQALPTKGAITFGPPKSGRSERSIALDVHTVEALSHHQETQGLERDLAGPAYQDRDLVFCNEVGQPIRPTHLGDRFVRLRKGAGLPMGSLHTLRHTHITIALTEGIPVHVVAARAGDRPE